MSSDFNDSQQSSIDQFLQYTSGTDEWANAIVDTLNPYMTDDEIENTIKDTEVEDGNWVYDETLIGGSSNLDALTPSAVKSLFNGDSGKGEIFLSKENHFWIIYPES